MKNRLKLRRTELELIQMEVAPKAGISQSRLSHIENELVEPTSAEIKALAKALKSTPADLFPGLASQSEAAS